MTITFAAEVIVTSFSIWMYDYGDWFPTGGGSAQHTVTLTAFDGGDNPVDWDTLSFPGTTSNGDAQYPGEPGQRRFNVSGSDITYVKLQFSELDPGIGFDDIQFDYAPRKINVDIDIKPGSYPNAINKNGKGVIPVAILGSADFDVKQIDVSTLSFAGMAVRVKGNDKPQCSIDDVSGDFSTPEGAPDGYDDLVCQFVDDTSSWMVGDGEATLTGQLLDGTPFEGTDSIKVVQ